MVVYRSEASASVDPSASGAASITWGILVGAPFDAGSQPYGGRYLDQISQQVINGPDNAGTVMPRRRQRPSRPLQRAWNTVSRRRRIASARTSFNCPTEDDSRSHHARCFFGVFRNLFERAVPMELRRGFRLHGGCGVFHVSKVVANRIARRIGNPHDGAYSIPRRNSLTTSRTSRPSPSTA